MVSRYWRRGLPRKYRRVVWSDACAVEFDRRQLLEKYALRVLRALVAMQPSLGDHYIRLELHDASRTDLAVGLLFHCHPDCPALLEVHLSIVTERSIVVADGDLDAAIGLSTFEDLLEYFLPEELGSRQTVH